MLLSIRPQKFRVRLVERDGRAHSVLVSGSLDARVRWLEFPHIPSVSLKKRARGRGGVYLGRGNSGNREGIRNQRRPYCTLQWHRSHSPFLFKLAFKRG